MPVKKTHAAAELMTSPFLTDPMLAKELRGDNLNLWQLLSAHPGMFTRQDLKDFLKWRLDQLHNIEKNFQTKSDLNEPEAFIMAKASNINPEFAFTPEDEAGLAQMMSKFVEEKFMMEKRAKARQEPPPQKGAKFARVVKAGEAEEAEGEQKPPTGAETVVTGQQLLDEAETLLAEFANKWFEIQLHQELEKKTEELKREVQRIVAMVRSGKIDAVWLLVALAKVNCEKNGLMFTQYGKRVWRLNDEMTKVTEELYGPGGLDPRTLQKVSQEQRWMGTQMQFMIQDMNKLIQNVESTMTFAKTAIDEIFKTRLHVINAPFKNL